MAERQPRILILDNPGDAIYGAITVGALLAAESPRAETYAKTVGAVAVTMALYWLAHAYADLAGERLRRGGRLTVARFATTLFHELPILVGAAIPLATVLVCWAAGAAISSALLAAVWTTGAFILAIEVAAGLRAHLRGGPLLAQALAGALLGALIVVLRALLH